MAFFLYLRFLLLVPYVSLFKKIYYLKKCKAMNISTATVTGNPLGNILR